MKTNLPVTNQDESVGALGTSSICIDNMSNNYE